MPIQPGDPTLAVADLGAALDALQADLVQRPAPPATAAPVLPQQPFSAFYHS